jgi:prophage antirepressor-like protein
MNELISLAYFDTPVRAILLEGELWFVAKDVAEALMYSWAGMATIGHVPEEWKRVNSVLTHFGTQEMATLSEQGLYFFLARSDKAKAQPFLRWIAGEVIPQIRRTGSYSLMDRIPKTLPEALRLAADALDAKEAAEGKLLAVQPKVEAFDEFISAGTLLSMANTAKLLGTGRDRLFRFLKDKRILQASNLPYQRHLDAGYFKVRASTLSFGNEKRLYEQVFVTTRGVAWIRRLLNGSQTSQAAPQAAPDALPQQDAG